MRRKSLGAITLGMLTIGTQVWAQEAPDPDEVYFFDKVTYGGNGCPQDSVGQALSEGKEVLTLFFDAYSANVGPDTAPSVTTNCNISLPIHIPHGWRYTLVDVGYEGYMYLDANVQARQTSEYSFQGQDGPRVSSTWWGPREEFWDISDRVGISSFEWSPCGEQRNLNIKTYVQVNNRRNRNGYGSISNDEIEAQVVQSYGIRWERCN